MILSDEPGYYEDGKFGIRIENIVKIVPAATKHNFQGTGTAIYCYRLRAVDTVPGTYQVPTRYQVPGTRYQVPGSGTPDTTGTFFHLSFLRYCLSIPVPV